MRSFLSIPGPPDGGFPLIRRFHQDPLRLLTELARDYGPLVRFRLGPWRFLLATGPDEVADVLKNHYRWYRKGPGLDSSNPLIGRGLLLSEGEDWARQRRMIAPAFKTHALGHYADLIVADAMTWIRNHGAGDTVNVYQEMLTLTLTYTVHTLFAQEGAVDNLASLSQDVEWMMAHFFRRSRSIWRFPYRWPLPFNRRYHVRARKLRAVIGRFMPPAPSVPSIWSALSPSEPGFDHHALTYLIAGHETTGNALTWAFYLLGRHPDIARRVGQEGTALGLPFAASAPSLPYTTWVFLETLRLYPPVWLISRTAVEPARIGSAIVPPGTHVLVCPWIMHRNPAVFSSPNAFYPERWEHADSFPKYSYIPFGLGPRHCIGERLAILEGTLTLALIAAQRTWAISPSSTVDPFPGLTLRPRNPFWVTLARRTLDNPAAE